MDKTQKSGLATAGLVLGIIGVAGCFVPVFNVVSVILGVLAVIFGSVALAKQTGTKGGRVAAMILGVVTIIGFFLSYFVVYKAADDIYKAAENITTTLETTTTNTSQEYRIGDSINVNGEKEIKITSVNRDFVTDSEYITPDAGKEFVKVNVEIRNTSSGQISYNAFNWQIQDSSGDIQSYSIMAQAADALNSGELASGAIKIGSIIFEVPVDDSDLTILYEDNILSSNSIAIKLQ
jgi:hypothetical protein